jgi:hypothetical protein
VPGRGAAWRALVIFQISSPSAAEIKATYKHDDLAILMAVSERVATVAPTLSGVALENVIKIQKQLDTIQGVFISPRKGLTDVRDSFVHSLNQLNGN